jgi:hypothetical protein
MTNYRYFEVLIPPLEGGRQCPAGILQNRRELKKENSGAGSLGRAVQAKGGISNNFIPKRGYGKTLKL